MVRIKVPRKYGVQREIELERARQNEDFNRRLKNAEDSMKAIYPEEYKKIRSRYFGNGNNLGLIGSQYNYIHDMITRRSDDQMKKYYNELNDYFIKQTGTEPGYMLQGVDVVDEAPDWVALRQKDFDRFYSPTENSDYVNSVEKQNARNAYLALQNKNADSTFDHDGYFDYDPNNGLLNTEANYARATGSYNYTPEERKAAATWERAENSPIVTAMEFSPLFPVVAGVKAIAAANAPQASGVDVGMNTAFAALPAISPIVQGTKRAIDAGKNFIEYYPRAYKAVKGATEGFINPLTPIIHKNKIDEILDLAKKIEDAENKISRIDNYNVINNTGDIKNYYWLWKNRKKYNEHLTNAARNAAKELSNKSKDVDISSVNPDRVIFNPTKRFRYGYDAIPIGKEVILPSTTITKEDILSNTLKMPDGTDLPIRSTIESVSGGTKTFKYKPKLSTVDTFYGNPELNPGTTDVTKTRTLVEGKNIIRGVNNEESTMAIRDYKKQLLSTPLKDANGNVIEGSTLGDKAIIQGSTLNEGLYAGAPNDTEILTTRSNYNDVERALGFKPSRNTANGTGVTGHSDLAFVGGKGAKENIDINIIEQDNNGYAIGKEAHEIAAHLFGNKYMGNYYTKSAGDGISDISRRIPKPDINGKPTGEFFTADELFDLYKTEGDPTQKHIYDAFVQSKDKAVNRARSMLNSTNKETINRVSDAIKSMGEQIIGYKGTKELYPNLDLTNKANNIEFLKNIGFTGDIEAVSSNPDMMRNVVDYWHIRNTIATRGVSFNPGQGESLKNLLNAVTSYGGGDYAGGGGNMIFGSEMGGGSGYVGTHLGGKYIPLTRNVGSVTNPTQLYGLSKKQKDIFNSPETDKIISSVVDDFNRQHGTNIKTNGSREGRYVNNISKQLNDLVNSKKITKEEYDELINAIANELDVYAYRGDEYGDMGIYAGNLSRVTEPTIHSVGKNKDVFGNKFEFGSNGTISESGDNIGVPISKETAEYPSISDKSIYEYIPNKEKKSFSDLQLEAKAIARFNSLPATEKSHEIAKYRDEVTNKINSKRFQLRDDVDNLSQITNEAIGNLGYENRQLNRNILKGIGTVSAIGLPSYGAYRIFDYIYTRNKNYKDYMSGNLSDDQMRNLYTQYLDDFISDIDGFNDNKWGELSEIEKNNMAENISRSFNILSKVDRSDFDAEMLKRFSDDTIKDIEQHSHHKYGGIIYPSIEEYKSGGIHIPESHRGRLTRLKERTGKTEEELYRTGDANVRKMITFARNARKWKHDDGGSIPPYYKSFDEWYNSLYQNKDTTDYNLRRSYELAPTEELENWKIAPETNHLHTVYWNGDEYEFMKKRNHPTLRNELDWYNSKDGANFRMRYSLDTTGDTYRYVPRYKVRIVEP